MPHEPGHLPQQGGSFADPYGPPPGTGLPEQMPIGGAVDTGGIRVNTPGGAALEGLPGGNGAPRGYFDGDEYNVLKSLTTEDRVRLQDQLMAIGLGTGMVPGEVDDNTVQAMSRLMTMANRSGTGWQQTLNRISTNPQMQEQMREEEPVFEAQPYLAPDIATIAQEIKGLFRDRLGRDPDEYEMAQLSSELTGYDRMAHQREQELAELRFDQQNTEGVQEPGEVRAVDPASRFREFFEKQYANELDFIEERETTGQISSAVGNTFGLGSQMIRGGG